MHATSRSLTLGSAMALASVLFLPSIPRATAASLDGRQTRTPGARSAMSMALDANGDVLLFGGDTFAGAEFFDDTWTWNGRRWTERHPDHHPTSRCCYGLAYDADTRLTILFGGSNGIDYFADTWAWDGSDWTQLTPPRSPVKRSNFSMAYDQDLKEIVLFGGFCNARGWCDDTWIWNGSTWYKAHPKKAPKGRETHALAYDSARHRVVLFGGSAGCDDLGCHFYRDTWTFDGRTWVQKNPPHTPDYRDQMGMAYDVEEHHTVMFGGSFAQAGHRTWIWDGRDWSKERIDLSPGVRERPAVVYDRARRVVLLYGGRDGFDVDYGDMWEWDGAAWTCLFDCPG
jgi:hypothetical protein